MTAFVRRRPAPSAPKLARVRLREGLPGRGYLLYDATKRVMDVFVAALALVLGAPLFLLIALAVVIESGRPVLYRGRRVGRDGLPITILKFRTMRRDADEILAALLVDDPKIAAEFEATFKLRNDPRCTRVGRLLRKTSLDELPQLWNVLGGSMSLVGPRPIVADELPRYRAVEGGAEAYLAVKPGLTGSWQVSGRSDTTYDERVRLDIEYVQNRSMSGDLKILARTPKAALSGHGAY